MNFKDYVAKHSTYSKEEVDDIIHSLSLEEKTNPYLSIPSQSDGTIYHQ